MRRWAAVAGVAVAAGGCASKAWTEGPAAPAPGDLPAPLPAHRAVERVELRVGGREFEFVGYRTCDPANRDVRSQWVLASGLSVLDVAVHGAEGRRNSGSVFEAVPSFADTAMEDLRRTWGSRSVHCADFAVAGFPSSGSARLGATVSDGRSTYAAGMLDDGSRVAVAHRESGPAAPVRVTLLDAALVPEATIDYSDFDENGVPREIHLADLRDGHTLDVEVEDVRIVSAGDGMAARP